MRAGTALALALAAGIPDSWWAETTSAIWSRRGGCAKAPSPGDYAYLDRAKVYAKAAEDGYLVVLRAGAIRASAPAQ